MVAAKPGGGWQQKAGRFQEPATIDTFVERRFRLGYVVCTPTVELALNRLEIEQAIRRHADGEWGELTQADIEGNEAAIARGEGTIQSAHRSLNGSLFWILTEWDRSATTVFFPNEY